MKTKILLIDDLRDVEFVNKTWNIQITDVARTYNEGIKSLKKGGVSTLLLDHDLACFDEQGNELTGYNIMLFLEEHQNYLPDQIILVTSNPVGRSRMQTIIEKLFCDKTLDCNTDK